MSPQPYPSINPLLALVAVGGAAVLASYAYFLPRVLPRASTDLNALWFGIDGQLRTFYYVSIVLSALCFLASFVWLLVTDNAHARHHIDRTLVPHSVLFLGAVLWSVALWTWGQNAPSWWVTRSFVVLALTITTVGAVWLLVEYVQTLRAPWWVCLFVAYLLFHVGAMDNIGWVAAFIKKT